MIFLDRAARPSARSTYGRLDTGGNDAIDTGDYDVWRAHFGETRGSGAGAIGFASAAVPEPTSQLMLILGMLAIFFRRRAAVKL